MGAVATLDITLSLMPMGILTRPTKPIPVKFTNNNEEHDNMSMLPDLFSQFDPITGRIPGVIPVERRLSAMDGYFADEAAFDVALAQGDPLLYTVASVEPEDAEGALWYAIGCIYPGKIGDEYFMTKGHYHAWRPASEYYIGLRGQGLMLLEDEGTGASRTVPLTPNSGVYVPGHTAHRTMNVGDEPLTYLGIYSCKAGHDYGAIAERNFYQVVVDVNGRPTMIARDEYEKASR
jgi:glucose-6-phosphate isomerase